jgi:hypothetical protein
LLNEADLFSLTLTFQGNIINYIDASVNVLFFRKQSLEDQFFIVLIKTVKILGLDLFFSQNLDSI